MNPEALIGAWLPTIPGLVALVGTRIALAQLPQGTTYPALVYTVIDAIPEPTVNPFASPQLVRARVQFNPLGATMSTVKAIQLALRDGIDFTHRQTKGGKFVVSCRADMLGPTSKDNEAGVYTQSQDYVLRYYE